MEKTVNALGFVNQPDRKPRYNEELRDLDLITNHLEYDPFKNYNTKNQMKV